MTNHRIHQAASQHAPHITLTVNRVNHAAITHLDNFAAPQHSLHQGATSNAAHNTVTRRTTLAATNHTDGSAIALHMTHTTIINDRPHAATREHRSDNTTTRHHANTTINLHNLTAARHRTNVTASRQTQHASITGHNIDARHRSRSILAPVVAHIIQPRVTRHLIQPAPTHADTPETAANDTTIHTRQHTSVATIRVQRMTVTAVNNVNHTVAATIPPGNISAAHALSRLPVTPVKTARSIHAQTIHATKSLTQPRHAAAETSRLARNQLLSSRLRLTPRPVMRRIRTKRTLTLPRTTLPRLTLTIHMPLHSHNRPHPSRKNTANKTPLAAAPPENKPETRGKQKSGGGNPSPTTRQ
jgi:hypothetical protein